MRRVEETARPEPDPDPYELMTTRDVARMLGCCTKTVYSMFRSGRLTHVRVGAEYRTTRGAVLRDLGLG